MSTHKHINKICAVAIIFSLLITFIFINATAFGIEPTDKVMGYENRLFDKSKVHTIDIVMDDWEGFIDTCENEEYAVCSVVIDGEAYKNVGIRAKGNTSLSSVSSMGSDRYSFKVEFDQYDNTKSYYGLDKLSLNNVIQDNTFMKDYLAYTLMDSFLVDAPLCSYVYITVNGEEWGLYLAVEGIEDAFLQRNYGNDYGELYKPDSMSFGGGRGNGKDFNFNDFDFESFSTPSDKEKTQAISVTSNSDTGKQRERGSVSGKNNFANFGGMGGFGGFGMGSSDVKLQYIDDDPDSYSNIFNNAKTDITKNDKERLIESLKKLSEGSDIETTVDVDEVIRYFVVHNFLCNGDSYTGSMIHNYYLYEEDGQLSMIPWDYNLAYGTFQGSDVTGTINSPIDTPVSGGMSDRPMISWIFEDEEYLAKYHELFAEFINGTDFTKLVTETAELISSYVENDPRKFCTYEEFEKGVEAMLSFCNLRAESVSGQLGGTIPSTSEGQSADRTALTDTTGLTISDMGTMGGGFGGRNNTSSKKEDTDAQETLPSQDFGGGSFGGGNFGGGMPGNGMFGGGTFDGELPEGIDPSQGFGGGNFGGGMPGNGMFGGDMFGGTDSSSASGRDKYISGSRNQNNNIGGYIVLGVTVLVLISGLIVALKYKKRPM